MRVGRLMLVAFLGAICSGALLLFLLQNFSAESNSISLVDAVFTSTSAVCVTGLIVHDTGSYFNQISQVVILGLIQVGGLGMLTFSNMFFLLRRRQLGLQGRLELEAAHGIMGHLTTGSLLRRIFLYTFLIELMGAIVLSIRFLEDYALPEAIWQGVFHSVSAFCNAGFSLFSDSLMAYRDDPVVNTTMVFLIVLGGLGFVVFADLEHYLRNRLKRLRPKLFLHTRCVLITTAILLVTGALVFGLLEYHGTALGTENWAAWHAGLFLSVTARTAGFNSVDTALLSNPTLLILMLFMLIGGSPGSTAGGIKTTTLAVLLAQIKSKIENRPRTEMLGRSIPAEIVSKSIATALVYITLVAVGVITLQFTEGGGLSHIEQRGQLLDHMFETVSAIATVGLSTGITASLSTAGKVLISLIMFIGRLGPVLIALSLIGQRSPIRYTLPEENINIG